MICRNKITAMVEDRNGMLWLGTQEEGIISYNPWRETFSFFDSKSRLPDSIAFTQINKLILDEDGQIIINTAFQGLFRYDPDTDVLHKIPLDKLDLQHAITIQYITDGKYSTGYNGLYSHPLRVHPPP